MAELVFIWQASLTQEGSLRSPHLRLGLERGWEGEGTQYPMFFCSRRLVSFSSCAVPPCLWTPAVSEPQPITVGSVGGSEADLGAAIPVRSRCDSQRGS